jgi:hypothetical protein
MEHNRRKSQKSIAVLFLKVSSVACYWYLKYEYICPFMYFVIYLLPFFAYMLINLLI